MVTEAIQRFDTSIPSESGSHFASRSGFTNNKIDIGRVDQPLRRKTEGETSPVLWNPKIYNKFDLSNKAKCQNLINQPQRQPHSSTKKNRKSGGTPKSGASASASSTGYQPILPAPVFDLVLKQSSSNVSPDSGIQSEGTVGLSNSSPPQLLQSSSVGTGKTQ